MKRLSKIIIAGTSIIVLGGAVAACSHHRGPEQRAEWVMDKMSKTLDLNTDQQAKLKTLSDDMLAMRKDMRPSFGSDREQVLGLLEQPTLNQAKVLDMVHQHTQVINREAPKIVSAMGSFYDSLTPQQQAKVREFVKDHHGPRHRYHDADD